MRRLLLLIPLNLIAYGCGGPARPLPVEQPTPADRDGRPALAQGDRPSEELKRSLARICEMIDSAARSPDEEALHIAINRAVKMSDNERFFTHIQGGEEMVRRRLPVFREALSSKSHELRIAAAIMLAQAGDKADIAAIKAGLKSERVGPLVVTMAAMRHARSEEEKKAVLRKVMRGIVGTEEERFTAMMMATVITVQVGDEPGMSLWEMLKSDDLERRRLAVAEIKRIAGDNIELGPDEVYKTMRMRRAATEEPTQ